MTSYSLHKTLEKEGWLTINRNEHMGLPAPSERVFPNHQKQKSHLLLEDDTEAIVYAGRKERKLRPKVLRPVDKSVHKVKAVSHPDYMHIRWIGIRSRAKKKKVPFDLTEDFVISIISSHCAYCNAPPKSELDRKLPLLGYVQSNIVPACRRCNTLKSNLISYEEMCKIIEVLGWWQQ